MQRGGSTVNVSPCSRSDTLMKASHGLLATFLASSHPAIQAQGPPFLGASAVGVQQPRIIGGTYANRTRYPYAQVSLQTWSGKHQCGGTLVAPDMILSAAHCIHNVRRVVVGVYDLSDTSQIVGDFKITDIMAHPKYDKLTNAFDVVLYRMDGNVTSIDPVKINQDSMEPFFSETLTTVGWGATSINSEYPGIMHEVELEYIGTPRCQQIESEIGFSLGYLISEDMMCAGGNGTRDTCSGDSGGPLLVVGDDPSDALQVGITSWGPSCGNVIPGIYHRTSSSFEWIRRSICQFSMAPPDDLSCHTASPTTSPAPNASQSTAPPDSSKPTSTMVGVTSLILLLVGLT